MRHLMRGECVVLRAWCTVGLEGFVGLSSNETKCEGLGDGVPTADQVTPSRVQTGVGFKGVDSFSMR